MLKPMAGLAQLTGYSLAHGDHERGRKEHADLAEVDLLCLVVIPGCPQDNQPDVLVVALDLRPQVEGLRILHRQLMQPEGRGHLRQFAFRWLEQAQPHEPALAAAIRRLSQGHRLSALPAAISVVSTVNDHLRASLSGREQEPLQSSMAHQQRTGLAYSLCAFSQVSAVSATPRQPLSMVSEWPRPASRRRSVTARRDRRADGRLHQHVKPGLPGLVKE